MATLVTGGTGFIGQQLIRRLTDREVFVVSRNRDRARSMLPPGAAGVVGWDPHDGVLKLPSDVAFDTVINLMGEPIAEGRWTAQKKRRLFESRVAGTEKLVSACLKQTMPPKVLISGSAVGIYGDHGDDFIDEASELGIGFLADLCREWERATVPLREAGTRVVLLRTGIVLGSTGGALANLLPLFRWGLGGRLGRGRQFMPWIHIDDLTGMLIWAIEKDELRGALNATCPHPVRNSEFTAALAQAVKRPAILPVPKFGLRLLFGEFADALFESQRVVPKAAMDSGYSFQFEVIREALADIVQKEAS